MLLSDGIGRGGVKGGVVDDYWGGRGGNQGTLRIQASRVNRGAHHQA